MQADPCCALPVLLDVGEACRALRISRKTLWSHTVPRGKLACVKIGNRVFYRPEAISAFVEASTEGTPA